MVHLDFEMNVENANDISELDENSPIDIDLLSECDDHLRTIKKATLGSFADMGVSGGVVVPAAELNHASGLTGNVQAQINAIPNMPWTRKAPDSFTAPTGYYNLVPNTTWYLVFTEAEQTIARVTLPAISSSSDADTIVLRVITNISAVRFFQIEAPGFERFRILTDANLWVEASDVNSPGSTVWPHVLCIFSSQYNKWLIRYLSGEVGQVV